MCYQTLSFFAGLQNKIPVPFPKEIFGDAVELIVIFKDYENKISEVLEDVENIDLILPKQYTVEELEENLDG